MGQQSHLHSPAYHENGVCINCYCTSVFISPLQPALRSLFARRNFCHDSVKLIDHVVSSQCNIMYFFWGDFWCQTPNYPGRMFSTHSCGNRCLTSIGEHLKRLVVCLAFCCRCLCFYCCGLHGGLMNRGPVFSWTVVASLLPAAQPDQGSPRNSPHAVELCSN